MGFSVLMIDRFDCSVSCAFARFLLSVSEVTAGAPLVLLGFGVAFLARLLASPSPSLLFLSASLSAAFFSSATWRSRSRLCSLHVIRARVTGPLCFSAFFPRL